MEGLSGFALAGYLNDLEQEEKRKKDRKQKAKEAIGTFESNQAQSNQLGDAKGRTTDWLGSLSDEELKAMGQSKTSDYSLPKDTFDADKERRQLAFDYGDVEGFNDYFSSIDNSKKKTSLSDANKMLDRESQFADLEELEKSVGMKPGNYNKLSPRDIAVKSGLPQMSGTDEGKDFMETYVEKPEADAVKEKEISKTGTGGGANVWSQKDLKYKTIPEALPRLRNDIDEAFRLGKVSEFEHDNLYGLTATDPTAAELRLAKYIDNPSIAARTVDATTNPKANQAATIIEETTPGRVKLAGETTAETETTRRKIQAENPVLSENQGGALSDAYNAVDYLNSLKSALEKGDLGYFDVDRKTGQFLNPKAGDAFSQLVEIVGRKRSGAAISESEWKNFGKQVLNKNNLLTEDGKNTALESLDTYIDKFYGAGVTTTGNEDWYNNYKSKVKSARSKAESSESKKYSDQAVEEAQEALNDPEAPESAKRAARKVLGQ